MVISQETDYNEVLMRYVKISNTKPVVTYLVSTILDHLQKHETVLWLIPGGSAITIASEVSKQLQGHDLSKLYVTLTDERYGNVGHSDSNWEQLLEAGLALPGAQLYPVLANTDRSTTTENFTARLRRLLDASDFKIGLFGIGADGHTAGILPQSPAVASTAYAVDYDANFQRITMTFEAIKCLDEVVVYAMGPSKKPVLDTLENSLPLSEQPAQILKQVPKLTIFNDLQGDTL